MKQYEIIGQFMTPRSIIPSRDTVDSIDKIFAKVKDNHEKAKKCDMEYTLIKVYKIERTEIDITNVWE
jgi:hypothetical protein